MTPNARRISLYSYESMKKSFLRVMKKLGVEVPVGADFEAPDEKPITYGWSAADKVH
jgi:hypothetical protein